MLASSSLRRAPAIVAALVASLAAQGALAQAPPDLPPLAPGQPVPTHARPPATPPGPTPTATPPGQPPRSMAPPGFTWSSPAEIPPGFAAPPGYYQMPYYPQAAPRPDEYAIPPPPPRRRNSMGLFVGGILMVGGGLALAITGAGLVSSASDRIDIYCDSPSFPCAHKDDDVRKTFGAIFMAGGALIGAAGIPMWLIGAKLVPVMPQDKQKPAPEPAKPALVPQINIGAGTATLTMHF